MHCRRDARGLPRQHDVQGMLGRHLLGDAITHRPQIDAFEQGLALADDTLGVEDEGGLALADQRGEPRLALDIGEPGKVLALDLERVEQEQGEAAPAFADRLLERREAGVAAVAQPDDLAVEEGGADLQLARSSG